MKEKESERRRLIRELRHADLLVAIVALLVVQSFMSSDGPIQRFIINGLFFVVVLSAIRSLASSRRLKWATLGAGTFAYALSWLVEMRPSDTASIAMSVAFMVVFSELIIALSRDVFSEGIVDANRIVGAISIYFMIGLAWAFLYAVLEIAAPGSFRLTVDQGDPLHNSELIGEFIYFSQVTLTTLGYGDVTPISRPARLFATLEAMVGQLYVAVVIARLVGLQISQSRES